MGRSTVEAMVSRALGVMCNRGEEDDEQGLFFENSRVCFIFDFKRWFAMKVVVAARFQGFH